MTERHVFHAVDALLPASSAELADMPVEFTAFCELHRPRYLSYARVWFQEPGQAAEVVRRALHELAAVWPEVLGSPNPAAAAWQILRTTVAEGRRQVAPTLLRPTGDDEDLAILAYVVGLATPEIADTVGSDHANVSSQLRHARRQSPPPAP